jgi:hypothetical protein
MGMYTSLKGTILVKPEYRAMIADLCDWEKTPGSWWDLANMNPQYRWLVKYAGVSRSNFIPRGTYAASKPVYNITDDGIWYIECELKDYEGTIDAFMRLIVANIALSAELESWYEEDAEPVQLSFYAPEVALAPVLGGFGDITGMEPCLGKYEP